MKEPEFKPWLVKEIASERKPSCEMFILPGYLSENVIYWWMQRLSKMDANKACVFGQTLPFFTRLEKIAILYKHLSSASAFNSDQSKILSFGKDLIY